MQIANECCWIFMSDSLVVPADCIAVVESAFSLCGIEERKDKSQLYFSQKLCACPKCIKPLCPVQPSDDTLPEVHI